MGSISVGVAQNESQATGRLRTVSWNALEGCFRVTADHKVGHQMGHTQLSLEPSADSVSLFVLTVPGWLTAVEAAALFTYANKVQDGLIVEIGAFCGRSTLCLAWGSRTGYNRTIFAIDPFTGSPEHGFARGKGVTLGTYPLYQATLTRAGIRQWVHTIKDESLNAVGSFKDGSVSLLFVDGDHLQAMDDLVAWYPKVKDGGLILWHDYGDGWPEVKEAVDVAIETKTLELLMVVDSIAVTRKADQ